MEEEVERVKKEYDEKQKKKKEKEKEKEKEKDKDKSKDKESKDEDKKDEVKGDGDKVGRPLLVFRVCITNGMFGLQLIPPHQGQIEETTPPKEEEPRVFALQRYLLALDMPLMEAVTY